MLGYWDLRSEDRDNMRAWQDEKCLFIFLENHYLHEAKSSNSEIWQDEYMEIGFIALQFLGDFHETASFS